MQARQQPRLGGLSERAREGRSRDPEPVGKADKRLARADRGRRKIGSRERAAGLDHFDWRLSRDVRLLEVSATRAAVQASVDTSGYDLVGGGHVEHRPSEAGVPLRFVLVWHDARWKVDSVLDATPGG